MSFTPPRKELTEPRTMRALAHPLRLKLLQLAMREGTLTATQASELTGESPANCSFHLRQLAKYGFVEAAAGGDGRERPWRPAQSGHRWSEIQVDPEAAAAAEALGSIVLEQNLGDLTRYLRTRETFPPEWRDAALMSDGLMYLTLDELRELGEELIALKERYTARTVDPSLRPQGARPVRVLSYSFPLPPTATGN
jgi:DNA-binding transcriptional ArsR family regulator